MAHWTFATEPERASVFAEARGIGGIHVFSQIYFFCVFLRANGSQHTLGREGGLAQAHADRVINRICDRRNRRRERALTAFFCAEWPLGIDALDDERLDFRRLDRRWAAVFEQAGVH